MFCGSFSQRPDTPDRFSDSSYKEDNFCDILFSFLHTKSILKRGLL